MHIEEFKRHFSRINHRKIELIAKPEFYASENYRFIIYNKNLLFSAAVSFHKFEKLVYLYCIRF